MRSPLSLLFLIFLKRIFCLVGNALRLIVADVLCAKVLKYLVNRLSVVTECNCAVVGESVFDKNVTVESAHFLDSKDTYATEGACRNGKNLALCYVCVEVVIRCGLEAEEGDLAGNDIAQIGRAHV